MVMNVWRKLCKFVSTKFNLRLECLGRHPDVNGLQRNASSTKITLPIRGPMLALVPRFACEANRMIRDFPRFQSFTWLEICGKNWHKELKKYFSRLRNDQFVKSLRRRYILTSYDEEMLQEIKDCGNDIWDTYGNCKKSQNLSTLLTSSL